jgi:4-hydroxy-L-threonine phosphate dehydrogenase PdxA
MRSRIGITLGDCAGIGPEIVDLALKSKKVPASAEYVVIGRQPNCQPGAPSIETARAAAAALEEAVTRARRGELHAVVTAPIHKARMYEAGFKFPGQTEFFAERCGIKNFAMCLTDDKLTVALVTSHIPLAKVPGALRQSEIVRVGLLLADFLQRRRMNQNLNAKSIQDAPSSQGNLDALGIQVRIAVCGLNPHAGESGKIGREEIEIIAPAVAEMNSQQSTINYQPAAFSGPHSPDTIFHRAVEGEFDAVLCMYHDQGLIPFKLVAFHGGVNTTLGLPFPRTSPDHGTAFEIAGKRIARPDSMIAAINLAVELTTKRRPPAKHANER